MPSIELASVNGVIGPLAQALIPVSDHGFLYGDSVYETIRTYGARPFLLPAHLDRLGRSAEAIHLRLPFLMDHLGIEIERLVAAARDEAFRAERSPCPEFALRVMTTRGVGPLGYDPALCPTPGLVLILRELPAASPAERESGVTAIISTIRRNPIASLDPRIKSSNLLNNILASHEAAAVGADEAILFNTDGELAEGTLTNIFFVQAGVVKTPSLECGLLSGVTRDLVLDLAARLGLPREEGRYGREALETADEIFLTSTTREVLPVRTLDGLGVGASRGRGPITARLQDAFRARVEEFLRTEPQRGA